jgi:hypothetical protein
MLEREERVSRLMINRGYIFTCSYQTTWNQYMTEDEKQDFTFEYIMDYIANI